MSRPGVTVVVTVYARIDPAHLGEALESLVAQSRPATEVVVVEDGPLTPALAGVLDSFAPPLLPLRRVRLERRSGNGPARQVGLEAATHELVALADADDVSLPDRLATQLTTIQARRLDLLGAAMEEVDSASGAPVGVRRFPERHEDLVRLLATRNPINHPSVMLRRSVALAAGGYRPVPLLEDYHLWARMVGAGAVLGNCPDVLVRFRGGTAMLGRRRGIDAVRSEWTVQRTLHAAGLVPAWRMPVNWAARNGFRLLPGPLMARAYRGLFLRGRLP